MQYFTEWWKQLYGESEGKDEISKKIAFLKEKSAKYKNVRLNFHTPKLSQIEADADYVAQNVDNLLGITMK